MNITRLTGILVSLLILMVVTSRHQANATDLQSSNDLHHNCHHTRHHLHSGTVINHNPHQGHMKIQHHPRVLHDSLKKQKKSEDNESHRNFRESRAKDQPNNPASLTITTTTSKTLPMYPTSVNDDRDGIVMKQTGKREKLTAVAVAEYSGTRAVAYAGYHGDQQFRSRDGFNGFPPLTTPQPIYTKHHPGRRVCTRQVPSTLNHHASRQIRFTYTEVSTSFMCCPGWSQVTRTSYGCNRPTCPVSCHNGGVCGTHGKCNCPKGFTGSQCHIDVDECITEKPCAQICRNLPGSYECHCRYGFHLQPDGQSCRKNNSDGTAFEARDLENDYGMTTSTKRPEMEPHDTENEVGDGELDKGYETILRRLIKLEKQFARGKRREPETTELTSKVDQAVEGVAELRLAAKNALHFLLETFGPIRQDVYNMKSKFDLEHRRVDYLIQRVAELDHRLNGQRPGLING